MLKLFPKTIFHSFSTQTFYFIETLVYSNLQGFKWGRASGLVGLLVFIACFHLLFSQYFDNRRRSSSGFLENSGSFATTHNAQQISIFMPYFPCHVSFFFSLEEEGQKGGCALGDFYGSFWYGWAYGTIWYLWMPTTATAICNTCDP